MKRSIIKVAAALAIAAAALAGCSPAPTPTAIPSRTTLLTFDGVGTENSQPFAASGSVQVAYVFNCSNASAQHGVFVADLVDSTGALSPVVNAWSASGDDGVEVSLAGMTAPYRIDVETACEWAVVVRTP